MAANSLVLKKHAVSLTAIFYDVCDIYKLYRVVNSRGNRLLGRIALILFSQ